MRPSLDATRETPAVVPAMQALRLQQARLEQQDGDGEPVTLYLAAPWNQREAVKAIRGRVRAMGHQVNAGWLDTETTNDAQPYLLCREAERDLQDINTADRFVLLSHLGPSTTGAMHVELGYALGWKPVDIIGAASNVFHYLPMVWVYHDLDVWLEALNGDGTGVR